MTPRALEVGVRRLAVGGRGGGPGGAWSAMAIPSCDPLYLSRRRGATAGGVPFTLSSGPPPPSPPSDISRASRAAARCASPPRVSTARGIARHHHHHHHPRSGWRRARRRSRSRASTTARRGQSASAVAFSGLSIRARKRGGERRGEEEGGGAGVATSLLAHSSRALLAYEGTSRTATAVHSYRHQPPAPRRKHAKGGGRFVPRRVPCRVNS